MGPTLARLQRWVNWWTAEDVGYGLSKQRFLSTARRNNGSLAG
jgi:hypothetical protein